MAEDEKIDNIDDLNEDRAATRFIAQLLGFFFGLFWYIRWNKQYDFWPLNQWFDFIR